MGAVEIGCEGKGRESIGKGGLHWLWEDGRYEMEVKGWGCLFQSGRLSDG